MVQKPIELHYWPTPNGHKITIMLEECGLPYEIKPVNIGRGDQFKPEFLAISPNNRMPAIIDPDGPVDTSTDAAELLILGPRVEPRRLSRCLSRSRTESRPLRTHPLMRRLILVACAAFTLGGCALDTMYDDHARTECDQETSPRQRGECYDRVEQNRRENP